MRNCPRAAIFQGCPSLPSSSSAWVLLRARNKVPGRADVQQWALRSRGSKKTLPHCCPWTGWSTRGHPSWTQTHRAFLQSVRAACQGTQQLWQLQGVCLSGQMAEQCGRCWSTAKSGVGKAHRFILIWTNWEVGYLHDAEECGCWGSLITG